MKKFRVGSGQDKLSLRAALRRWVKDRAEVERLIKEGRVSIDKAVCHDPERQLGYKNLVTIRQPYEACIRFIHIGPRKVRALADMIRGKRADDALRILRYQPQRGARLLEKVLKSALGNADDRRAAQLDKLVVVDARVDGGPMFKRVRPRARGMAFMIKRRMSHIRIAVDNLENLQTRA